MFSLMTKYPAKIYNSFIFQHYEVKRHEVLLTTRGNQALLVVPATFIKTI